MVMYESAPEMWLKEGLEYCMGFNFIFTSSIVVIRQYCNRSSVSLKYVIVNISFDFCNCKTNTFEWPVQIINSMRQNDISEETAHIKHTYRQTNKKQYIENQQMLIIERKKFGSHPGTQKGCWQQIYEGGNPNHCQVK